MVGAEAVFLLSERAAGNSISPSAIPNFYFKEKKTMKKNTMKKLTALACAGVMSLSLAACGNGGDPVPSSSGENGGAEGVKIGILQYAQHPSLDNCYEGVLQGLAEAGYTDGENGVSIEFQNANGSTSDADLMAKTMVSTGCDMIIAVATPAAMSAYAAAKDAGVPVIYTAASDPIGSGLAKDLNDPETGASGTKDALNLKGQMKMIRAFLPEADTIGILYTTSEPNSVAHLKTFQELAPEYGFTIEAVGITNESEVASGAATLVAKGVDCVNNFTDNNVVNNLSTLLHATDEAGIPVFGSEEEQVRNGCVASESLDYVALGAETGAMAAAVLNGEADIMTLPVSVVADSTPVYSAANCAKFGITLPEEYSSAINLDEAE